MRNKVLRLPDLAKFELYEALRDDLIRTMSTESLETRRVREGREALATIKAVAEKIGSADTEKLTVKKFDTVSRRLELGWSSARIIRLYGTWRLAISVYRGDRQSPPIMVAGRLRGRASLDITDQEAFDGIRQWLSTKPTKKQLTAYTAWVVKHNAGLKETEKPLLRGNSLHSRYSMAWPTLVDIAEGKITLEAAREKYLAERTNHKRNADLIGGPGASEFLGLSPSNLSYRIRTDKNFPIPVAHISNKAAWLMGDLRLYKRGLPTPDRVEDEAQPDYMDVIEIRARLGIATGTSNKWLRRKRWNKIPEPDGYLGIGYPYWKRAKAEKWFKKQGIEP